MTIDRSVDEAGAAPTDLPAAVRQRIFLYLRVLSFLLKNKLHLEAHEVATFRLVAAIPLYLSFAFGFIRDSWNPFGMRDRGFMLLFGGVSALLYAASATVSLGTTSLLFAVIALTV